MLLFYQKDCLATTIDTYEAYTLHILASPARYFGAIERNEPIAMRSNRL